MKTLYTNICRSFIAPFLLALCSACAAHSQSSVVISSPAAGVTVVSPIQLNASVTGNEPTSLLLYDNHVLILHERSSSSLQSALTLTPGSHILTVVARYGSQRSSSATSAITVTTQSNPTSPTSSSNPTPASGLSVADQISEDMQGSNEGFPHGVPLSYDWANGPVMEMGNNASGWNAITAWGVLYVAAEGNPTTNTRVNIRNVELLLLQKSSGKWLVLQNTSTPVGGAYVEDFAGDVSKPADIRTEPDGTISSTAGGGFNFHFYPADRASINPNDIGGIVSLFEARLIVADPSQPDDRSTARYLCQAGADYYPALTGGWPGDSSANPGVGIGKMKYVQSDWRSFAMTTLTDSQLAENPPPVSLAGVLP